MADAVTVANYWICQHTGRMGGVQWDVKIEVLKIFKKHHGNCIIVFNQYRAIKEVYFYASRAEYSF